MKKKKILFYFYNRLNDPLLQSNIFHYIHELAKTGLYDIAIITYEDIKFPLTAGEKKQTHEAFAKTGISWYPLTWHAGSRLYLKAIDVFTGFFKVFYLAQFKGYKRIITLGSIAGSYMYFFSRLFRIKFYLYQYEPHSEYALDNSFWQAGSLQYKLLQRFEKKSVQRCSVVSSGTYSMKRRLEALNIKGQFFKVASVVNEKFFYFDAAARKEIRARFNISDTEKLVIYPGKVGELYCSAEQLLTVFKTMYRHDASSRFLVITPGKAQFNALLNSEDQAFKKAVAIIPPVSHNEIPGFLSASDFGIVAVLPGPSKKFMSPIKIGEYLCCGLPYLICHDLEDSGITLQKNIGVVVNDFSEQEISGVCDQISQLMHEPKQQLTERCHAAGIALRGFDHQYKEFVKAIAALTS